MLNKIVILFKVNKKYEQRIYTNMFKKYAVI